MIKYFVSLASLPAPGHRPTTVSESQWCQCCRSVPHDNMDMQYVSSTSWIPGSFLALSELAVDVHVLRQHYGTPFYYLFPEQDISFSIQDISLI